MKIKNTMLSILFIMSSSGTVYSEEVKPTCESYGCADCSCVAQHPDIKAKMSKTLSEIKKVLIKNGIPPEAAEFSLKGYSGEQKLDATPLTDNTVAGCCCGCGSLSCKWTFDQPTLTK